MHTQTKTHIRWMIRRDIPNVLSTESHLAEPWSEEEVLGTLRDHKHIGCVIEAGDQVAGHMIYRLRRTKLVLLHMAVHPDFRRCGLGRALMGKLLNKLSTRRRQFLVVRVDESDLLTTCQFLKRFDPDKVSLADGQVRFMFRAEV